MVSCVRVSIGDPHADGHVIPAGARLAAYGQARALMSGEDAKKVFGTVRKLYALQGRENDFREIQRQVAMQRIHHEEPPAGTA